MLNLTRRLGLVGAMPLVAACAFLAFAGCAGGGAPPVTTSRAAGLPLRSLLVPETNARAPKKIYVVNAVNSKLTTYKYDGTRTTPTITDSISDPQGLAVDRNGKIYVANYGSGSITTYDRFGNRTTPTISVAGAIAVAVDTNGKIYVGHDYVVTTYNPDGSQTTPTIVFPHRRPAAVFGVAVDANGKIYVTSWFRHREHCVYSCYHYSYTSQLTTYNPDGSNATPTIELIYGHSPSQVVVGGPAIDANGKIYVVKTYFDTLNTYRPGGSPTKPVIGGLSYPSSVAVDANGKIYVTSVGNNTLTTYTRHGSPTTPTITGLDAPTGVALH
jgi:NHL repeat